MAPGNIFLLHDGLADREPMLCGLENALTKLSDGFEFVTVGELIRSGTPVCNLPIRSAADMDRLL